MAKRTKKRREKTAMRTGSRVICVDDRFPPEILIYYTCLPIKNRTYTVRGLSVGVSINGEPGEVAVYLDGMHNPHSQKPPYPERGFASYRFMELEPPKEATIKQEETATA